MMASPVSPAMPGAYRFSVPSRERIYSPDTAFFSPTDRPDRSPSPFSAGENEDDLNSELAYIEKLRRDVRSNLSIRPIPTSPQPDSPTLQFQHKRGSTQLDLPPLSATSTIFTYRTAPSSPAVSIYSPSVYSPLTSSRSPYTSLGSQVTQNQLVASLPDIRTSTTSAVTPSPLPNVLPEDLASELNANPSSIPLVLDTRTAPLFQKSRIRHSVNLAIPSLILKRCRKPGSGFASLASLKTFITTDEARTAWDMLMDPAPTSIPHWNGDIIVTDDEMQESPEVLAQSTYQPVSGSSMAWTLIPALTPLTSGRVYFLQGGMSTARRIVALWPFLAGSDYPEPPHISAPVPSFSKPDDVVSDDDAAEPKFMQNPEGNETESVLWSYLHDSAMKTRNEGDASGQKSPFFNALLPRSPSPLGPRRDSSTINGSVGKGRRSSTLALDPEPRLGLSMQDKGKKQGGLFMLRTDSLTRKDSIAQVEGQHSSTISDSPSTSKTTSTSISVTTPSTGCLSARSSSSGTSSSSQASSGQASFTSTLSAESGGSTSSRRASLLQVDYDASPSPSPSASSFPSLGRSFGPRRGMSMNLGIDTRSAEKLRLRTSPPTLIAVSEPEPNMTASTSSLGAPAGRSNIQPGAPKLSLQTPGHSIKHSATLPLSPLQPTRRRLSALNLEQSQSPKPYTSFGLVIAEDNLHPNNQPSSNVSRRNAGMARSLSPGAMHGRSRSRDREPETRSRSAHDSPSPPRTARPTSFISRSPFESTSSRIDAGEGDGPQSPTSYLHYEAAPPSPSTRGFRRSNNGYPSRNDSPDTSASDDPDDPSHTFTVSTILPNFLYLGPEMSSPEHVAQLQELGVKRVLNMALECEDEHGFGQSFEKYMKIPMRDTVEEENVKKGVREVCKFLDDARLHSQPTYVHCKAGKSRSVTAVMAYLIHANHWPLAQAYAFVLDRRKGISPNIGFVSELMSFEEEELGAKSLGVISSNPAGLAMNQPSSGMTDTTPHGGAGGDPSSVHATSRLHYTNVGGGEHDRTGSGHGHSQSAIIGGSTLSSLASMLPTGRRGHVRESMPPAFQHQPPSSNIHSVGDGDEDWNSPLGPEAGDTTALAQEVEIKDAEGRYRHARRAPVDELTLQPMRRSSKAGLESSNWFG